LYLMKNKLDGRVCAHGYGTRAENELRILEKRS
jgi:hypothetical protein